MADQYHHLMFPPDKNESLIDSKIDSKSKGDTKQIVIGPGGKKYSFSKGISPERINKYFTKQGWQLKNGRWLTASGEDAGALTKVGSPVPNASQDVTKRKNQLDKFGKLSTDVTLSGVAALPSVLGAIGGMLGRTPGAALGGGLGEAAKDMAKGSIYDNKVSPIRFMSDVTLESLKQAGLQKGGEKLGEVFFRQLDKLPKAVTKKGIPLLPSDLKPNSMLMKYIEDLHSNLAPSAGIMGAFKLKQQEAILKATTKIANGFAKFNGTSEEIGVLVKNTMLQADKDARIALKQKYPKMTVAQIAKTAEYKEYMGTFRNGLSSAILKTDKPEDIVGFIRGTSKGSLEDTRVVTDLLNELKPETLGKVKNRLLRDIVQETITGSKDPVLKGSVGTVKNFSGSTFKSILDTIGDEKLKAIYSPSEYKAITDFNQLIAHVNKTQGNGMGKFLNLTFLLPFRSGVTIKGAMKLTGTGFFINRTAKILTSTQGVRLYENYIRATAQQAPRAVSLARDEIIAFNEKSDKEYELEEQVAEDEYRKSLPEVKSLSFGSDEWEKTALNK